MSQDNTTATATATATAIASPFFPEELQQVRDGMTLPTWAIEVVEWSVLITVILFLFSKSLFGNRK